MREYKDEAYIFSLSKYEPGKIIACRTPSGGKDAGRNIFSCLKMSEDERDFFKEASATYGNLPIAALCKGDKQETVLFFRDLVFGASLCLAVVVRFDADRIAAVLESGTFGEILTSPGIKSACNQDFSYGMHGDVYGYLLGIFSSAGHIAAMKLDYCPAGADLLISCASASAELADVEAEIDVHGCDEETLFAPADDIFDGRISAAVMLTVAMVARFHSKDKKFCLEVSRGIRYLSIKLSFRASDDGWKGAFDHLKHICEENRGIPFPYEVKRGRVSVTVVPFYSDVSFVGVKDNDYFTSLVDLIGDR